MGAGKTTVGAGLARRWDRAFRDSDADLRDATGLSAAVMASRYGADALHEREAEHLRDSLLAEPAPVIAAAASTVDRADSRAALRHARVVWLDADVEDLVLRQREGGHRPQYGDDPLAMLRAMDAARRPHFEEVADVVVRLPAHHRKLTPAEREAEVEALIDTVAARLGALAQAVPDTDADENVSGHHGERTAP